MGRTDAARVDVAALLDVARQYQAAADLVDAAVRTHLTNLEFDGAVAGRAYTARGDTVRVGISDVVSRLHQWSRAAAEIAATLRVSADRYLDAEVRATQRMN